MWGKSFKVREVCGRVVDFQGALIPGAKMQVMRRDESRPLAEGESDNNGNFYLANVPNGTYVLRVQFAGFPDASQLFKVVRPKTPGGCQQPIRVVMNTRCCYVENAWKHK